MFPPKLPQTGSPTRRPVRGPQVLSGTTDVSLPVKGEAERRARALSGDL